MKMVKENASAQYSYAPLNTALQRPVNPAAYISDYTSPTDYHCKQQL